MSVLFELDDWRILNQNIYMKLHMIFRGIDSTRLKINVFKIWNFLNFGFFSNLNRNNEIIFFLS